MKPTYLDGPADLAIEIVSEGTADLDYRDKRERYRGARISEYRIVDPFRRELTVDFLRGESYETRTLGSGRLESCVVPGFWIEKAWLWIRPLPRVADCLREIQGPDL